jgi:EAL domain-containing protein (putative c-di-GMP-specific phosphodiesterase class I)
VARLGSSEFGILLSGLEESVDVETVAGEIAAHAPRRIVIEGEEIFLSLRIGAAVHPQDGDDAENLITRAGLARQAATDQEVHFFSTELDAEAQQRRRVEGELRYAIDRDELHLLYQPIVDLRDRRVIAVEALVRWRSRTLGNLGPQQFIPIAEETDLITPIGQWIMEAACRQGKDWYRAGIQRPRISVNVSMKQIREEDFVERVARVLKATSLKPGCLAMGMEITETELMENVQAAVAVVRRLRSLGVKTYIDDFGTGYSSLSYLRDLPIDSLKIDASFVRDIPGDADAVAVIKGIITMAHGLELRVIAEGVETEEQYEMLRDLGCDAAQGYLLGRPAAPEVVESMLRESEAEWMAT